MSTSPRRILRLTDAIEYAFRALYVAVRVVLQVLQSVFADLLFCSTARVLVPLATLGFARVEPFGGCAGTLDFNAFGVARRGDGVRVFSDGAGMVLGLLIWIVGIAVALIVMRTPAP